MRKRIHITLPPKLLEQLDHLCLVSCCERSNRSGWIEHILRDFLSNACAGCGKNLVDEGMWMVPDRVWNYYVMPPHRRKILCLACWKQIIAKTDNGKYARTWGYTQP